MTDTPAAERKEMVVAFTPQQLFAMATLILVVVLVRRTRKRRSAG